jgi:hypothetical protein
MAQSSNRTNVYPVQEELRSSEAIRRKKGDIAMESSLIHPNNKYAAPTLHACEEGMKTKLIPALLGAKQTRQQATEESQVLLLWNNSVTEHNPHLCVHDLFCKQAAQTPHFLRLFACLLSCVTRSICRCRLLLSAVSPW